jgi:hypothetical protein
MDCEDEESSDDKSDELHPVKGAEIKDRSSMTTTTFCHSLRSRNFDQTAFCLSTF